MSSQGPKIEAVDPTNLRFAGRVALVTGGASGIGAATVTRLAGEGARVLVFDLDEVGGQHIVERVESVGGEAVLVVGNTAVEDDARRAIQEAGERWGRLDIVVNNAGKPPPDIAVEDLGAAQWYESFEELHGCFFVTKHAVRLMKRFPRESGTQSVVFIASMAALKGVALRQAYCAMKHGVLGLSRALAIELAPDRIRVNCVAVGPVDTPFLSRGAAELQPERRALFEKGVPLGRIGQPSDIANIVVHLSSDESDWITGNVVRMAGGTPAG